jgi:hypothetical protein
MKALGGKFAEATWNKAIDLWGKLWPEVNKRPEVAKAIQEVADKGGDPRVEAILSWQLEKVNLPPELLNQIKIILDQNVTGVRIITADRGGVAVGGNAEGCTITAGYHNFDKPE